MESSICISIVPERLHKNLKRTIVVVSHSFRRALASHYLQGDSDLISFIDFLEREVLDKSAEAAPTNNQVLLFKENQSVTSGSNADTEASRKRSLDDLVSRANGVVQDHLPNTIP